MSRGESFQDQYKAQAAWVANARTERTRWRPPPPVSVDTIAEAGNEGCLRLRVVASDVLDLAMMIVVASRRVGVCAAVWKLPNQTPA
jgi:hypothetical protein